MFEDENNVNDVYDTAAGNDENTEKDINSDDSLDNQGGDDGNGNDGYYDNNQNDNHTQNNDSGNYYASGNQVSNNSGSYYDGSNFDNVGSGYGSYNNNGYGSYNNNGYGSYNNNGYGSYSNNGYGGYNNNGNGGHNNNNGYNNGYGNNNYNGKPKKSGGIAAIIIAAVASLAVLGFGVALITNHMFERLDENQNENVTTEGNRETTTYPQIASTDEGSGNDGGQGATTHTGVIITDVSDVVDNVMPSIVAITSSTKVQSYNNYEDFFPFGFGYGYGYDDRDDESGEEEYEETGAGSGIVVKQTDTELLIVTNNHVVEGADSLSVLFNNGKAINAVTKSTDETADIAIVSIPLSDIDKDTLNAIKIAQLGSSDELEVGEGVIAIGNALGYGQSVTTGVISAKNRAIQVDDKEMIVLQTDAAINGGNSGGALLNSEGKVIGINVAKYSSSSYSGTASIEGMGFAIPISQATDIINSLMTKETRSEVKEADRGTLGIQGQTLDSSTGTMLDLPQGIYIKEVIKGGAAEKAGLMSKDIITKFDDQTVSTMDGLKEKLKYYKAGETVNVTVYRITDGAYEEKNIKVTLGKASDIE